MHIQVLLVILKYKIKFKQNLPDLHKPKTKIAVMKRVLFDTAKRSQMGGKISLAKISVAACTDRKVATSCLSYPMLLKKKGVTILKFCSAT